MSPKPDGRRPDDLTPENLRPDPHADLTDEERIARAIPPEVLFVDTSGEPGTDPSPDVPLPEPPVPLTSVTPDTNGTDLDV